MRVGHSMFTKAVTLLRQKQRFRKVVRQSSGPSQPALMAKVDFQQLPNPGLSIPSLKLGATSSVSFSSADTALCCCESGQLGKAQIHTCNLGPEQSTGKLSSMP